MKSKISNFWENMRTSLWFMPAVLSGTVVVLAFVLLRIDTALASSDSAVSTWLFSGTADAARTILSVIAGSLITVVSIAFSLTIIALQQASSQFSPRVLRQFTSSRSNQIVIGSYIATFIYALLVLRSIRSPGEDADIAFVPALSITVALLLAFYCLALLIYFIHHISQSLQVTVIMERLRDEVIEQINNLFVGGNGELAQPPGLSEERQRSDEPCYVYAHEAGFVRRIDQETLQAAAFAETHWVYLWAQVGDYVPKGGILAELGPSNGQAKREAHGQEGRQSNLEGSRTSQEPLCDEVRSAFVLDIMRSIYQDPMFGVRQLVDIALKALSPGINDPTTAEHVLFHLGDILGRLARAEFPAVVQLAANGKTRIISRRPDWENFVDTALSQIRRVAQGNVHVTITLLQVLHSLALQAPFSERAQAIRYQLDEIRWGLDQQPLSPRDAAYISRCIARVERAMHSGLPAW